jgi:hypothetical protein
MSAPVAKLGTFQPAARSLRPKPSIEWTLGGSEEALLEFT